MKTSAARDLGRRIASRIDAGDVRSAYALLAPVLAERTPFRLLDQIGGVIGAGPIPQVTPFLDHVAAHRTEGGWVIIASALHRQLDRDAGGVFARCRDFISAADIWYAADILGERAPGPALVADFDAALVRLAPWRADANRWIRRAVGVAVHFWAKRARGAPELAPQAGALLAFLSPLFEEQELDAVKGIGWGLKTLGRQYPDLVAAWVREQVVVHARPHRALMVRKALTYLPEGLQAQATGASRVP